MNAPAGSPSDLPSRNAPRLDDDEGRRTLMRKILFAGLLIAAAVVMVNSIPDIAR